MRNTTPSIKKQIFKVSMLYEASLSSAETSIESTTYPFSTKSISIGDITATIASLDNSLILPPT